MIDKNLPIGIKVKCKSQVKKSGCHFVVYNRDVTESGEEEIEAVRGTKPLDDITKELENNYIDWTGSNGRKITSYERVDKDVEYDKNGNPVKRQYSMDRQHRFWIETEDSI